MDQTDLLTITTFVRKTVLEQEKAPSNPCSSMILREDNIYRAVKDADCLKG